MFGYASKSSLKVKRVIEKFAHSHLKFTPNKRVGALDA